jgi:hypothetical protein
MMDLGMEDRLQKLGEEIKKANYKNCDKEYMAQLAEERINELQQRGVHYVDRFVQKLLERTVDKEAYLDILIEGRFAIILARNNFSDIEIEYAEKGLDIKARWNRKTVYFEITRKHPSEDDKRFSLPGAGPYWIKRAKSEDIIGKIQGKLRQLKPGEINIVVLWSDTPAWNQHVLGEAHSYIRQEIDDDSEKYNNLNGVLFTNGGGVNTTTLKQFYLFKNDKASKPLGIRLTKKLDSLHERDLKKLQREMGELAAAFKRLKSKQTKN